MGSKFREPNRSRWWGMRPAHDGDNVDIQKSANNATVVIYTVPDGKVLMLCSSSIMAVPLAVGSTYIRWNDDAGTLVRYLGNVSCLTAVGAHTTSHLMFWPPIEIPAGHAIVVFSGAAGITGFGAIHGWVENA